MACRKKKTPKRESQSSLVRFEGALEVRLGKCSHQQDSVDTSEKDPPCLDSSLGFAQILDQLLHKPDSADQDLDTLK